MNICPAYPMSTYHLLHHQYRKSLYLANFMGFGCNCVKFAFFESHRPYLCFKKKVICRAMHSSAQGPWFVPDPTAIRGLKHSCLHKTGLAVIISEEICRIYVNREEIMLMGIAWWEKQSHLGAGAQQLSTRILTLQHLRLTLATWGRTHR